MVEKVDIAGKADQQDDAQFLRMYLEKLRRWYKDSFDLIPEDLANCSETAQIEYETEAERVARLADTAGFDGSLFRDYLLETPNDNPLSLQAIRRLRRKIETVPRIIAKLGEPVPNETRMAISTETKLLTVAQVAKILRCGESTLREQDKKGLVPKPVKFGGSIRWNVDELDAWLKHRCPNRVEWERNRDKWMEVDDVAA